MLTKPSNLLKLKCSLDCTIKAVSYSGGAAFVLASGDLPGCSDPDALAANDVGPTRPVSFNLARILEEGDRTAMSSEAEAVLRELEVLHVRNVDIAAAGGVSTKICPDEPPEYDADDAMLLPPLAHGSSSVKIEEGRHQAALVTNPGTTPITISAINSDHGLSFAGEETRTMV